MAIRRLGSLAVVAICTLAVGCKFWQTPTTTSTSTTTSLTPKFAFVANFNGGANGSLRGYTVDSFNGGLSSAKASVIKLDSPIAVAAHPNGKFIYVANQGGTLEVYALNRTAGTLGSVASSSFASGHLPSWLGLTPDGKFVYVLMADSREIQSYSINSDTGNLTAVSTLGLDGAPARAAFATSGRKIYVALGAMGMQIVSLGDDGKLSAYKTVAASPCSEITAIALDRKTRYAFAANGAGGGVCNYSVNPSTGDLTLISSALNPGGSGAVAIALNPAGTVLLTANNLSNNVTAFAVASDGTLLPLSGSPVAVGQGPSDVMVDPSGTYVYVTNSMENTLSLFKISSDKNLQWGGTWTTGPNPRAISVIP